MSLGRARDQDARVGGRLAVHATLATTFVATLATTFVATLATTFVATLATTFVATLATTFSAAEGRGRGRAWESA